MNQRSQPSFLASGALPARGLRRSSSRARVADPGLARSVHARRARRLPQGPLHSRSRGSGHRRRHHAGRGEAEGRSGVRRWKKAGTPIPATSEPAALSAAERLAGRAAQLGADQPASSARRASSGPSPDYDALTVANRVIGGPERPAVRAPARGEGLHLRRRQRVLVRPLPRIVERDHGRADGSHRSGADRSARRDPPDARHAGAGEGAGEHQARDRCRLRADRSRTRPRSCNNYIDSYVYKLPADYWDTYPDRIDAITAADVQRVAQKYWAADRLQVVAVGDAGKIEPALKKLGTVQTFDAEGKAIK